MKYTGDKQKYEAKLKCLGICHYSAVICSSLKAG